MDYAAVYCRGVLLWSQQALWSHLIWCTLLSLLDSVAAALAPKREKSGKFLVHLNPWRITTVTPRLCMLWPTSKENSSRWETVCTCILKPLISGKWSLPDSLIRSRCTVTQTPPKWNEHEIHMFVFWLSAWSQPVQWSAPTGKRMWMKICIQNITGSPQTTLRDQILTLQNPSGSVASRRSSVTGVATGNLTPQRSNCDSINSTGRITVKLFLLIFFKICLELT